MMAVREFEEYIKNCRKEFRENLDVTDIYGFKMNAKIKNFFKECTNQFEEDTLIENLKEEFEDYLKEFKEENTCPDYTEEDRMDDVVLNEH